MIKKIIIRIFGGTPPKITKMQKSRGATCYKWNIFKNKFELSNLPEIWP